MPYNDPHDWIDEIESGNPPAPPPRGAAGAAVPIAAAVLGIAIGAIGASLWWVMAGPPRGPATAALDSVARTSAPVTTQAVPALVQMVPAASAVRDVAAAARDDEAVSPAMRPPAAVAPALSAEEVARRKERAWARFYKRPTACEGNPSADQLIECGNHFIRAKREFDERWRTGTL